MKKVLILQVVILVLILSSCFLIEEKDEDVSKYLCSVCGEYPCICSNLANNKPCNFCYEYLCICKEFISKISNTSWSSKYPIISNYEGGGDFEKIYTFGNNSDLLVTSKIGLSNPGNEFILDGTYKIGTIFNVRYPDYKKYKLYDELVWNIPILKNGADYCSMILQLESVAIYEGPYQWAGNRLLIVFGGYSDYPAIYLNRSYYMYKIK